MLRKKSTGTMHTFIVDLKQGNEGLLSIGKERIDYTFYFISPSVSCYNTNLIAFICILSALNVEYVIDAGSMFPYILEALRNEMPTLVQAGEIRKDEALLEAASINNYRLASEISNAWAKIIELEKRYKATNDLICELFDKICGANVTSQNIDACAKKLLQMGINGLLLSTYINQNWNKR